MCAVRGAKGLAILTLANVDMKISVLFFAAVLSPAYSVYAQELHPSAAQRFTLEVEKPGLFRGTTRVFQFGKYRGNLDYNDQSPELSKVQFEIESSSIMCLDTRISDRDKVKIIRSALDDMLAADAYPTMSFVSNRVTVKTPTLFEVTGMLSIRDVIKTVTISIAKSADTYDGAGVVNMKDFGLTPPSVALGLVDFKERMTLKFHFIAGH